MSVVYLNIPTMDRDDVENYDDIRWDKDKKLYYISNTSDNYDELTNKYKIAVPKEDYERDYLFVPFLYKDDAKKHGFKWDAVRKQWYILKTNIDRQKFIDTYHKLNFYVHGGEWHMLPLFDRKPKEIKLYKKLANGTIIINPDAEQV